MDAVAYYVAHARAGDLEEAFHGLRELGQGSLPAMQSAYHEEEDPCVRALIVEAVWRHCRPSALNFLAGALQDPNDAVWKQALDGLVALASPASIRALRSAWDRENDPERRDWIKEAIGQTVEAVARQTMS